jgi:apolipoprotein N-acyltransferase
LVLFPESATSSLVSEEDLKNSERLPLDLRQLLDSLKDFSTTDLLLGIGTYSLVDSSEKEHVEVNSMRNGGEFYRLYNSALYYQTGTGSQVYHKSKLVPGGEQIPFQSLLRWVPFIREFKKVTTPQPDRMVFERSDAVKFAPLLCYESTFGEYVGDYVAKGATVLCVMTNDAYWQDTPQPKQHLLIDRLRAIEYRRSIARASHHGHSGFINQRGDFVQLTQAQVPTAMTSTLRANDALTLYAQRGDVIGWLATALVCLFVLVARKGFVNKEP